MSSNTVAIRRHTDDLVEAVKQTLLLAAAKRPLVACSGGIDSMVLLAATGRALSDADGGAVCSVDHGIRKDSRAVQQAIRDVAGKSAFSAARVVFTRLGGDIQASAKQEGLSLEDALRRARYAALWRVAQRLDCDVVLLAHSATDQLETVLMKLMRGAGTQGLSGMRELSEWPIAVSARRRKSGSRDKSGSEQLSRSSEKLPIARPFLQFSREQLERWRKEQGIPFVEDPSNSDLRFLRNRVRRELLPAFRALCPTIEATTARACQNLSDDAAALKWAASQLDLSVNALRAAPSALRFRRLSLAAEEVGAAFERVHLHAIDRMLASERGTSGVDIVGGRVIRAKGRVSVVKR